MHKALQRNPTEKAALKASESLSSYIFIKKVEVIFFIKATLLSRFNTTRIKLDFLINKGYQIKHETCSLK